MRERPTSSQNGSFRRSITEVGTIDSTTRSVVAFLATAVFFGGTFVAAKAGLEYMPPLLFVALRFDIAAVVLLGYVFLTVPRERWLPKTRADLAGIAAAGLLTIGLANAMIFLGQQYVTSAVASVVFSLNPILTPVFATLLLSEERLDVVEAIGMAVALGGVAVVMELHPTSLLASAGIGHAILLVGAVAVALGGVLIKRVDATMPSTARTAWGLPLGAAFCHLLAGVRGEQVAAIEWNATSVIALGYVAVFSGALAYMAYFGLIDEIGATRANLTFYLVPIVAAIGGWAVLGEAITVTTVAGFLVVFAGFALINREQLGRRLSTHQQSNAFDAGRDHRWNDGD